MLLVIPVSHVDLDRAERLAKRILKYGDMRAERAVICSTWNASWDIDPFIEILSSAIEFVSVYKIPTECELGWPEAANHTFVEASKHVHELDIRMPWYFMEADNTPLRPGWFDALKKEYKAAGKPYMGVINKSRWVNKVTGEQEVRGRHMVGTGIYPPDFMERSELIHRVDIVPWDVAIGPEIIHEVHDTKLISHHWGCRDAVRRDGLIYCESIDPAKEYNAGVIPSEAVVCHGIKDGSLDKVLDESESAGIPAS